MQWPPAFMADLNTTNYGMWNAPDPALTPVNGSAPAGCWNTSQGRVCPGEGGVDLSVPVGTPVYALASGTVIGAGYWKDNAHGVVTTRINVPGAGTQDLYYQHIQVAPGIQPGQMVTRGQQIGTVGPFNEIELGFNSLWGGVWGTNHPGPWVADPRPWLRAILSGSGAPPANSGASTGAPSATPANCGVDPLCYLTSWWTATAAPTLVHWGEYIAIFLIAVVLIIIGFVLLNERAATNAVRLAGKAAAL